METPGPRLIPARSKRDAMDLGLVLASQGIESTITQIDAQWGVLVEEPDFKRAKHVLHLWREENRGWRWRRKIPGAGLVFHGGSAVWVFAIFGIYIWSLAPAIKEAGIMDSQAVLSGQWWRLFTAVTLHADVSHLFSNAAIGFLFLGLAMAQFGAGFALLAAYLAGAAGNAAALVFYPAAHQGLGASGMVMGALGLLAASSAAHWRRSRLGSQMILRGVAAAFLILVLLGFSPETDVLAHVGGFVAGVIFGFVLSRFRVKFLRDPAPNLLSVLILLALVTVTWWLALRH